MLNKFKIKYCIDCGKQLSLGAYYYGYKRCIKCADKDKNNPNYKHGKCSYSHYCSCGREMNYRSTFCFECSYKHRIKKHYYCIDCNKEITKTAKRCSSCSSKKNWKENIFSRKKLLKSLLKTPNKQELKLNRLLSKDYKFVGDGKVILGGFNPDFINVNGQKKIIELFGDYWHKLPNYIKRDKRRLIEYKKLGYKTLVIWEHELEDINILNKKLLEFDKQV